MSPTDHLMSNDERSCIGCGQPPADGDVFCPGCREGFDCGSNPADWPPPTSA